ncbi:MAG: hypothetical protein EXS18_00745 [Verrucomicrobiae bacterium]|nr:hypothetical protein [Verrucomicrobiae bacterium]
MKRIMVSSLAVVAITLFGCSKSDQSNSSAPTQPSASTNQPDSTGQALEKYGHTMATAKRTALTRTDLITVDRAIQSFQADRGKNPESLDELIKEGFLPRLPDPPKGKTYSYNPQTTEVKIVDAN